ncbi:MAG: BsaA family SipW-dependent biofilm matrix protein [Eubacteriaceae bacterium]
MNFKKNKKKTLVASLSLAAVMILAATFAWFTSKDSVQNHFETGALPEGSVNVWEEFTPPEDWQPGQAVEKRVGVINNSVGKVFVRLSFEEQLQKLAGSPNPTVSQYPDKALAGPSDLPIPSINYSSLSGWQEISELGLTATGEGIPAGAKVYVQSTTGVNKTIYTFGIYDTVDGKYNKMSADFTVNGPEVNISNIVYDYYTQSALQQYNWGAEPIYVTEAPISPAFTEINHSQLDAKIRLAYDALAEEMTPENWWYNPSDGYFYYVNALAPGEITPLLLKSVELDSSAGNDYQMLRYDLFVKVEGIQATQDAVTINSAWEELPEALVATYRGLV